MKLNNYGAFMKNVKDISEVKPIPIDEFISDKDCPSSNVLLGAHNFKSIDAGTICNCSIWTIIFIQIPWGKFRAFNGQEVLIKIC